MPPTIPSRSFPISSPRRHPFLHSFPTRRSSDLAHKRCWIGRANAIEQALKVARQSKGSRQACNSAGQGESNADRKSTRLNSSHRCISYAVFCLKKKILENASQAMQKGGEL